MRTRIVQKNNNNKTQTNIIKTSIAGVFVVQQINEYRKGGKMNFLILMTAAIIAWFLAKLFEFADKKALREERRREIKAKIRAYYNGSLYKKKCQKVQDKMFDYYYDFALTDPICLAHFLAEREVEGVKAQRRIDYLYKQING